MRPVISSLSAALAALAVAGAASAQSLDDAQLNAENGQQAVDQGLLITQQAVEEKYPGEGQRVPTNVNVDQTHVTQSVTSSAVDGALSGSGAAAPAAQFSGLGGGPASVLGTTLGLSQLTSKF